MKIEDVSLAKSLKDKIENLESALRSWGKTDKYYHRGADFLFNRIRGAESNGQGIDLTVAGIDFDILKTLSMSALNKELKKLEAELDAL